jgi:hypothetical protein
LVSALLQLRPHLLQLSPPRILQRRRGRGRFGRGGRGRRAPGGGDLERKMMENSWIRGFCWDFLGFYGILLGFCWFFLFFYGILLVFMGFCWDFVGFYGIFMGFCCDFVLFLWDFYGILWDI